MPIATGLAIGLGVAGAVGSVASSAIGANAAGNAADAQVSAANHAADLQKQEADNSLAFQKQEWDTQQKNLAPWLQTGQQGLSSLSQLLGIGKDNGSGGFGSLLQGYGKTFQAPTVADMKNDPGYQFRLSQGLDALTNSAAARGGLLSSGTGKGLQQFGQDYASNEYNNMYSRSLSTYGTNYNQFLTDNTNKYNRLAALSGTGQTAANQLGMFGQDAASNITRINSNYANNAGDAFMNAGNARASGYISQANAINGGISGVSNSFLQSLLMNQYLGGGGGGNGPGGPYDPQQAANQLGIGVPH